MVLEVPNNKKENQNQLCTTRRNPISFLPKQKVNILCTSNELQVMM